MPGKDNYTPTDPLRYLVHGTKDADRRNTLQENRRRMTGWVVPELMNNYGIPDPPKIRPRYRLHLDTNLLEIDGDVDVVFAFSGDVMFYLSRPFWRTNDVSYSTNIEISGNFNVANILISSIDGAVSAEW